MAYQREARPPNATPAHIERWRDLTIMPLDAERALVLACDSLGAIGPKSTDAVYATGFDVGYFTARVALIEALCAGAMPNLVVDTLAVEWEPTGRTIFAGVQAACAEARLADDLAITGSTEENVATSQTGIGVTVIALANRSALRQRRAQVGDGLYLIGLPKSAPHQTVTRDDPDIIAFPDIFAILAQTTLHDAAPVGSHGALWEAHHIATDANLTLQLTASAASAPGAALLQRSGGPATALVVAASQPLTDLAAPIWRFATLVTAPASH